MEFHHKPVLFEETIQSLAIRPEGLYIDGTMGGGGHSEAIVKQLTTGRLLSIDQDPDAMRAAGESVQNGENPEASAPEAVGTAGKASDGESEEERRPGSGQK